MSKLSELPVADAGLRLKARRLERMLADTFPASVLEGKDAFDVATQLLADYALASKKMGRVFGPFVNFEEGVHRPDAMELIREGVEKGQVEPPAEGDTLTSTSPIPGRLVEIDNFGATPHEGVARTL